MEVEWTETVTSVGDGEGRVRASLEVGIEVSIARVSLIDQCGNVIGR